ncbi:hypothetical protein [Borrelia turicatae]|uniref:hypothetical protein n=1 Tax=Borrelia turicatae TaxID=142 RepID=UPI001FF29AAC|nr:hypothetical protein [Borrelia turicatae]UPA14135.1 hypothetical protein bt91E135_001299 [Borrelia turicatae 91E135]
MIKVREIKLYKVGEVVKILNEKFQYQTNSQILCRKAAMLNAYVTYNDIRYIPEDIICDLTTNIRKREIKTEIQTIIEKKLENIKENIKIYDKKHNISPITAINRIKSQNTNTSTIVKAVIQLKEEMQKIREQTQEEIQNIKEQTQKELKDKNQEIIKLKEEIKNMKEQTQETIQINLLKEVQATLNHLVYKESKNNHCIKGKKNI